MAAHWTLATRPWFISFFLNLASHIPPVASSCNNQIPNRTTASASHGGGSPTRCPGVDDSISVVVDVSLPFGDGTISTLHAHGTRSTMTTGSSQARTFDSSQPAPIHPIAKLCQRQELGKEVLGFAVPMTTGLLFSQYEGLTHLQASAVVLALSVGFTTTWNGMLLRGMCPRFAISFEYFGVGSVLVAFFGMVSSFLPLGLVWACWLCCGLSCLPFLFCLVPPTAVEEASSAERLEHASQISTLDSSQPAPIHQITKLFQRRELGKEVLGFAVPMTTGLLFNQYEGLTHLQASAVVLALSVGFTTTWNGMLLRGMCPRFAIAFEYFGVGSVLVAFFGMVSSFLPLGLVWACWLCCGLSCLPFLFCLVPPTAVEEASSAERLEQGIVWHEHASQISTLVSSQPAPIHQIAKLFQRRELGKEVLGFAVPMTTGLLFSQYEGLTHLQASAVVLALSVGFTTTWNGMLLRGMCPRFAIALEYFGVGSVLVAFFGMVSSFLPPTLVWACWLCCGLSCLPSLLCLVPPPTVEEESSAERLEQGIVWHEHASQTSTLDSSWPGLGHPIAVLFRSQELGKEVLGFAVPMTTRLLFNQYQGLTHLQASAIVLALSVGFTTTWNGMLLRGMCPRFAIALEYFGVGSVLVAFFGMVSSFLPLGLVWACWLCCGLSCLPFLLCLVPPTAVEEASSAERLEQCIVWHEHPSQTSTLDSSRPNLVHPIASLFRSRELGKEVLGFAVPTTTGLLFSQYEGLTHLQASAIVLALSIGFTTTWNGMLLRGMCPRFASALEYFGVVSILVAFFGLVSSFLPPGLVWACWLYCGLSCLPFFLCLVLPAAVEEASSAERLDEGIV